MLRTGCPSDRWNRAFSDRKIDGRCWLGDYSADPAVTAYCFSCQLWYFSHTATSDPCCRFEHGYERWDLPAYPAHWYCSGCASLLGLAHFHFRYIAPCCPNDCLTSGSAVELGLFRLRDATILSTNLFSFLLHLRHPEPSSYYRSPRHPR